MVNLAFCGFRHLTIFLQSHFRSTFIFHSFIHISLKRESLLCRKFCFDSVVVDCLLFGSFLYNAFCFWFSSFCLCLIYFLLILNWSFEYRILPALIGRVSSAWFAFYEEEPLEVYLYIGITSLCLYSNRLCSKMQDGILPKFNTKVLWKTQKRRKWPTILLTGFQILW